MVLWASNKRFEDEQLMHGPHSATCSQVTGANSSVHHSAESRGEVDTRNDFQRNDLARRMVCVPLRPGIPTGHCLCAPFLSTPRWYFSGNSMAISSSGLSPSQGMNYTFKFVKNSGQFISYDFSLPQSMTLYDLIFRMFPQRLGGSGLIRPVCVLGRETS